MDKRLPSSKAKDACLSACRSAELELQCSMRAQGSRTKRTQCMLPGRKNASKNKNDSAPHWGGAKTKSAQGLTKLISTRGGSQSKHLGVTRFGRRGCSRAGTVRTSELVEGRHGLDVRMVPAWSRPAACIGLGERNLMIRMAPNGVASLLPSPLLPYDGCCRAAAGIVAPLPARNAFWKTNDSVPPGTACQPRTRNAFSKTR